MFAALGMDVGADTFDLSFHEPPLSERSGQPMLLGMGDPVAGPLLGLFYDAPSTPEQLAGPPDLAPAHSHSCDNFRICMKGELIVGQERYHHGEFRLQQSGRPTGRTATHRTSTATGESSSSPTGAGTSCARRTRRSAREYRAAASSISERYGDLLPELLDDDDGGVVGMVTNLTTPLSKLGHIDGSFRDADAVGHHRRVEGGRGAARPSRPRTCGDAPQHARGSGRGAGVHVRHRRLPARRRRLVPPRRSRAHDGRHAVPVAGHAVGAGHRRTRRSRRGRHPGRPAGCVAHGAGRPDRGRHGRATSTPCSTACAGSYATSPDARSSTSADRLTFPAPLRGIRSTVS